ncbi:Vacuolar protein sorting-associated protein 41 [Phytophthora cinnamomi]|uniref:Vacuolar protein sorting-associated protein 41 n=1 Tax=Phytophthora cinnamomi TaxID=4785 RepID=UPI003559FD8F|nr:Vacuolar protein sorting-associated protein 41 [Phytophthora cinnamomi]
MSTTPESASQENKEEPAEPLLKYERVGGHFHAIFKDDSLSCVALHVNFVCAGTYGGNVLLLELDGRFIRRLHQHYKKVNQVCIDETGQFIASCSDDGTVAVYTHTLFPASSAAGAGAAGGAGAASDISGHKHASNQGKDVAARQISVSSTGGEVNIYNYFSAVYALIINKKGWIIDKGEHTVHEGEGPVQLIRWKDGLVAWANDWGVKVYDSDNDQRVTYIERPPNCPPMELCRCHLEWQGSDVLLVAWAHTLRVVTFKKGHSGQPGSPTSAAALDAVEHSAGTITAEVVALLTFDFFVAGISPWGGGSVVSVLAFRPPGSGSGPPMAQGKSTKIEGEGESGEMPYPEVHVVRLDGKQVSADLLNLKGYQRLQKIPEIRRGDSSTFTGGGEEYEKLWEKYVYVFAQRGQLSAIARYMPTASPRLPKVQYEMVLKHFLDSDPGQLLELIRKWPKPRRQDTPAVKQQSEGDVAPEYTETTHVFDPLYDAQAWINQLETVVRRRRIAEADADRLSVETMYLMEALAELYTATEQYDHALRIYLSQGEFCSNKDFAFKLITEHQLWSLVANKVVNLMRIDKAIAVRMLVNQTEQLKISDIVAQLEGEPELLHTYLHELVLHRLGEYNSEIYSALHERQVALYAEFAPDFLLKFLQTSNFVPLEKAYKYCSEHTPPLWDTMIYILGRMGQHKKALDLILTQRGDINQAIQFVQNHDEGLWDYLIDLSLTSKDNVEELLKFASQHKIDPIKLIRKIPDDMEIENLKQKLIAIITNYRVQQNLCIGSRKVELLRAPSSGMETVHACVFECGHCYHLPCLEERMRMWKSAEAVESGDFSRALGCFVCDHSTRAYARSGDFNQQIAALTAAPARGVTEDQLQRAKDNLLTMASVAE